MKDLSPSNTLIPEALSPRLVQLGTLQIHRVLPARERRMIGPWCFVDRYGPIHFDADAKPMDVGPHPHIGLQAVSWLLEGEILHRDSLDSEQLIRAGELSLTTSGNGIAHSEETPTKNIGNLNGVQLWVALPDPHRTEAPSFQHVEKLPVVEFPGITATVFLGEFSGKRSPGRTFSPLMGADVVIHKGDRPSTSVIPLDPAFEHACMVLEGNLMAGHENLHPNVLYYLGTGRTELIMKCATGARMLLIGGIPFREKVLMWWNFVARNLEEFAAARKDWEEGKRFGEIKRYTGPRMDAPPLRT